ncbi:hypothetical protein HNR15_001254 [Allobranchiibius huperziae]|uniref:Uncharacterized protein n=1 Tax=Allobranchiibius huperziae TaxID=1874116 RepID=A0A853DHI2_9MICO|nr:hypothetical protein [Allobranchiibius huperziae]
MSPLDAWPIASRDERGGRYQDEQELLVSICDI